MDWQTITHDAMRTVLSQVNNNLAQQGMVAAGMQQPMLGLANGGFNGIQPAPVKGLVPGMMNPTVADDTVIKAKKGEYVFPVEVVQALGGPQVLDGIVLGVKNKLGLPEVVGPTVGGVDSLGRHDAKGLQPGMLGAWAGGGVDDSIQNMSSHKPAPEPLVPGGTPSAPESTTAPKPKGIPQPQQQTESVLDQPKVNTPLLQVSSGQTATGLQPGVKINTGNIDGLVQKDQQRGVVSDGVNHNNSYDLARGVQDIMTTASGNDITQGKGISPTAIIHGPLDPVAAKAIRDRVDWSPGSRNNEKALRAAGVHDSQKYSTMTTPGEYTRNDKGEWVQGPAQVQTVLNPFYGKSYEEQVALSKELNSPQAQIQRLAAEIPYQMGNQFDGAQKIAGINAQIAGLQHQAGLDSEKYKADQTLEGHRITATEAANARIEAAREAAQSRVDAARIKGLDDRSAVNREDLQTKRDIGTRLREAQRLHAQALKSGDSDRVAEAVDNIAAMNGVAEQYGIPGLPVPPRPQTSDELAALREQAITNLKAKRGTLGNLLNLSPSKEDIAAEIKRLSQPKGLQPGGLGGGNQYHADLSAALNNSVKSNIMPSLPPAAQHSGRIIRDLSTGRRMKAVNGSWQEVR